MKSDVGTVAESGVRPLAEKVKAGDPRAMTELLTLFTPEIKKAVNRLGLCPNETRIWGFGYFELLSQGEEILLFKIVPAFDPARGDFLRYARRYLKRELSKILWRERMRLNRQTSLPELNDGDEEDGWQGIADRNQTNSNGSDGNSQLYAPDGLRNVEIRHALESVRRDSTLVEGHMIERLMKEGRLPRLREVARESTLSISTVSRKRRKLKERIAVLM